MVWCLRTECLYVVVLCYAQGQLYFYLLIGPVPYLNFIMFIVVMATGSDLHFKLTPHSKTDIGYTMSRHVMSFPNRIRDSWRMTQNVSPLPDRWVLLRHSVGEWNPLLQVSKTDLWILRSTEINAMDTRDHKSIRGIERISKDLTMYLCKVKVKFSLRLTKHHAMRTYWGNGGIAPLIDLGTRWKWVVGFTPRSHYPQGKRPLYPLDRRLGGPQSRSGRGGAEKNIVMNFNMHICYGRQSLIIWLNN
jgi:hypothetical protein